MLKLFSRGLGLIGITSLATLVLLPVGAHAEGENIGDTQQCVYLSRIDQSPAIDNKTILLEMKGNGGYKRVDLVSNCPGLTFDGFIIQTSINRLCKSDTLTVNREVGAACMIEKIVTIDETEAAALRAK